MAIEFEAAEYEIKRMAQLKGYPKFDAPAEGDLVRVALEVAESPEHLARAIDSIMDESTAATECPRSGELRRILSGCKPKPPREESECKACDGTGWIVVKTQAWDDCVKRRVEVEGTRRCACGTTPSSSVSCFEAWTPGKRPETDEAKREQVDRELEELAQRLRQIAIRNRMPEPEVKGQRPAITEADIAAERERIAQERAQ